MKIVSISDYAIHHRIGRSEPTGTIIEAVINYIWEDWTGLDDDYCIIGFDFYCTIGFDLLEGGK